MRVRTVLIGLALVIVQTAITPYNDYYLQGTDISGNHFPLGAVFTLIFLTLVVNPILKQLFPRAVLSPAELMVVWVMMAVASAIPSKGMIGVPTPLFSSTRLFCHTRKRMGRNAPPALPRMVDRLGYTRRYRLL